MMKAESWATSASCGSDTKSVSTSCFSSGSLLTARSGRSARTARIPDKLSSDGKSKSSHEVRTTTKSSWFQ